MVIYRLLDLTLAGMCTLMFVINFQIPVLFFVIYDHTWQQLNPQKAAAWNSL